MQWKRSPLWKTQQTCKKTIETNHYEIGQLERGGGGSRAAVDQLLEDAKAELQGVSESARQILQEYDASNAKDTLVITPQGRVFKYAFRIKRGGTLTAAFAAAAAALVIAHAGRDRKRRGTPKRQARPYQRTTGRL